MVFISFLTVSAQDGFRGGISVGVAGTQVDGDRLDGYNLSGFTGGIFVINEINEDWSFSLGIRYFGKGSRKNADPENGDYSYYHLRLHYVEIPILGVYHWKKFSPEAGIGVGYLIKALEDSDGSGNIDPYPPFNKYDFPVILGVSYEAGKHLRVNTQYSYSMIPIRPHPANQTWYFDRGQYNNTINLNIQYTF